MGGGLFGNSERMGRGACCSSSALPDQGCAFVRCVCLFVTVCMCCFSGELSFLRSTAFLLVQIAEDLFDSFPPLTPPYLLPPLTPVPLINGETFRSKDKSPVSPGKKKKKKKKKFYDRGASTSVRLTSQDSCDELACQKRIWGETSE